jgi:dehydrogenase/reductase SDR family member 12
MPGVISVPVLIDQLLELLIVPSFTRLGFVARSRLFGWPPAESTPLAGRTIVITGPTSGLGREAAGSFARMGARLILVGRDPGRLESTATELRAGAPAAEIEWVVADLALLASVRQAVDRILELAPRIDVIVDNAGAMFPDRQVTAEGFERTFATMVLGPFVLVGGLLPRLLAGPDPRIVAVTSGGMYAQALPLDDLQFERGVYEGTRAYARAKRAQVVLIREWSRRLAARRTGLRTPGPTTGPVAQVNAMHPGWADTPGLEASLPGFRRLVGSWLRTPAQGADTMIWLAASGEARGFSGQLVLDRRQRPFDRVPSTRLTAADRRWLWDQVVALTGEGDPIRRLGALPLE